MSLEQAIHALWAADEDLAALLPVDRLVTGRSAAGGSAHATIERTAGRPLLPTNAGNAAEEITLRLEIWHAEYDAGRAIFEAARVALGRATLELDGGQRLARLRWTGQEITQHADGPWRFTLELVAHVCVT